MTTPTTNPAAAPLEAVLTDLIREHEQLLELTKAHRAAISRADGPAIGLCIRRQNEVVQRIAALEARRIAALGLPPASLSSPQPVPTFSVAISNLPTTVRERLAALGDRLRALLAALHHELRVLHAAAESLAGHMDGIMRQIGQRLSQSPTYDRPRTAGAAAHSHLPRSISAAALDIRS